MAHWLMKSEPEAYSWDDLVREGEGTWDGVRNHSAALNLKTMQVGDEALFYHSVSGKEVVGVMTISSPAAPDPTEPAGTRWVAVKVKPRAKLRHPVTLATLKADPALAGMVMLRQSRLSVAPLSDAEFAHIVSLGGGLTE
jgi:predicted RNA-binding protein with PUA-like domain